jgi:hypothetical protein
MEWGWPKAMHGAKSSGGENRREGKVTAFGLMMTSSVLMKGMAIRSKAAIV